MATVSALPHPARRIAVFRRGDLPRGAPGVGLALWRVGDPGNLGTILRTADALGPAFVALSDGCADPTGPKAVRASMGAEREGLPDEVAAACDARASIELAAGAESLNVAIAAALALYELRRRQG